MMRSGQLGRHKGGALPLPLAGEGWGGGVSATDIPRPEIAPTRRFAPTSPASAGQSHLQRTLVGGFLAAILRDARLWRAPQDEVLFCGETLDPHGEERRLRRVSNHKAGCVHSHQGAICDGPALQGSAIFSSLQFQSAHEISFSDRCAFVAQDVVGGGCMEKEIGQRERHQEPFGRER